jgi:hypothetical protein
MSHLRLRGNVVDTQVLRITDLVARKPPRARETIAPNLLGVARPVDPLVADRRKELGLQRQGKDVVNPAFQRERFDGTDDAPANPLAMHVA